MPNDTGYIDTNVVLRLLTNDIPKQKDQAIKLIDNCRALKVTDVAIIETIYALAEYYKVPRPKIAKAIEQFYSHKKIEFDYEVFKNTLRLYASQPSLSIEDCYLANKANADKKMPLWTFDKKLAKQAKGMAKELSAL